MRIDSHVHVWRAAEIPTPDVSTIISPQTDVPAELLLEYMDEYQVERAVLVQPLFRGEDNSYIADVAKCDQARFAAVCVVDPRQDGAGERLVYWAAERGCRGLRLRPRVAAEAAAFVSPATYPLWEAAERLHVIVSVLAGHEHLSTVASLAERFPNVAIVIDHLAHPTAAELPLGGSALLLELARYPRIYVKLSGFYYFTQQRFPYDDCRQLLQAVHESFGPRRLLWGSDFPHVLLRGGYGRSSRLVQRMFDWLRPDERSLIEGANALALYWPT